MTTVVVDRLNKKIFADTKMSNGNGSHTETIKVFKEKVDGEDVIFAIAGVVTNSLILKDFFVLNGFGSKEKPEFKNYSSGKNVEVSDNDFELLVLFQNKRLLSYSIMVRPIEITEKYYCVGSGGEYAKAIITYENLNRNPIDIKKVFKTVSMLDSGTNNKIKTLSL